MILVLVNVFVDLKFLHTYFIWTNNLFGFV